MWTPNAFCLFAWFNVSFLFHFLLLFTLYTVKNGPLVNQPVSGLVERDTPKRHSAAATKTTIASWLTDWLKLGQQRREHWCQILSFTAATTAPDRQAGTQQRQTLCAFWFVTDDGDGGGPSSFCGHWRQRPLTDCAARDCSAASVAVASTNTHSGTGQKWLSVWVPFSDLLTEGHRHSFLLLGKWVSEHRPANKWPPPSSATAAGRQANSDGGRR